MYAGLVFVALAIVVSAYARDYHVSSYGDDSQTGSQQRPWRTIAKVNDQSFAAGDRVLFRAGDTFDGNLLLKAEVNGPGDLTIGSYGRGRARIRAGKGTAISIRGMSGIAIRDLIVLGGGAGANDGAGVDIVNPVADDSVLESITINNVEASGFHWAGIYIGGPALPIHRWIANPSEAGFRKVRISRSTAHHNVHVGIRVGGKWQKTPRRYANSDVTIADCVAHDNTGDPKFTESHSGNGILVDHTEGAIIERCTAFGNGALNGSRGGGPVGIWTYDSTRITIQRCIAFSNRTGGAADGGGFDLDGGVSNSVIQYNYSYDNDGPGYLVWAYASAPRELRDNVIRYNISAGDARAHEYGGIHVGTSRPQVRGLRVYGNTVIDSAGNPRSKPVWIGKGTTDINVHNNLFLRRSPGPVVEIQGEGDGVRFEGNAYWNTGGAFLAVSGAQRYSSLESWRLAGQENAGVWADPRLSSHDLGTGVRMPGRLSDLTHFRLSPGSPLIDAGIDLVAMGWDVGAGDFWGGPIPVGRGFDIGAHEFSAQMSTER